MGVLSFLKSSQEFLLSVGLVPGLLILGVIAFFLGREIYKSLNDIKTSLHDLKKHSDQNDLSLKEDISKDLNKMQSSISCIEKDCITKEEHYRDLEGWKSEIVSLRKDLSDLPMKLVPLLKDIT